MRKIIFLLALFPALTFGQGIIPTRPGQTTGKVIFSKAFTTPGCYASGTDGVAITRNSVATYIDANGNLQTCQANEYRVDAGGIVSEPPRTNSALNSNAMTVGNAANTGWTADETPATPADVPKVGGTWAAVSTTSVTNNSISTRRSFASSTKFVVSVYMKKPTGSGKAGLQVYFNPTTYTGCACALSDGSACTTYNTANSCLGIAQNVTTTEVRMWLMVTASAAVSDLYFYAIPNDLGVNKPDTTWFTGYQIESVPSNHEIFPTSLIVTDSTAGGKARAEDRISATIPAMSSKWCIGVTGTPNPARPWGQYQATFWNLGTIAGANSSEIDWRYWEVYDAAGGSRYTNLYPAQTVAEHRIATCVYDGSLKLYIDGTLDTTAIAGTGTGIISTFPTTLHIGNRSGAGGAYAGSLKNLKICTGSTAAKLCK